MRYALDTNAVIAALNGVPPVLTKLSALEATDILLPAPVVAELFFGARASKRVRENVARVDRVIALFGVQPFDEVAVRRFAEIEMDLRRLGRSGVRDVRPAGRPNHPCGVPGSPNGSTPGAPRS